MDWDRVTAARKQARAVFALAGLAIALALVYWVAFPTWSAFGAESPLWLALAPLAIGIFQVTFWLAALIVPDGLHLSRFATPTIVTAMGIGGVIFGLVWMWRIYKAPTKSDGAHWRFHDH